MTDAKRIPWPWPGRPSGTVDRWALEQLVRDITLAEDPVRLGLFRATRADLLKILRDLWVAVPPLGALRTTVDRLGLERPWTAPLDSRDRERLTAAAMASKQRYDAANRARAAAEANMKDEGEFSGWLSQMLAAAPGHVFTALDISSHRGLGDRHQPTCRLCTVFAGSTTGRDNPCPGDRHQCPTVLEAPADDLSAQWYKHDGWVCTHPGDMSPAFLSWTCTAGHVVTRAGHSHGLARGKRECYARACPWEDLSPDPAQPRREAR